MKKVMKYHSCYYIGQTDPILADCKEGKSLGWLGEINGHVEEAMQQVSVGFLLGPEVASSQ